MKPLNKTKPQIYNKTFNNCRVNSYLCDNKIVSIIKDNTMTTTIQYNGLSKNELKDGHYIKPIKQHVDDINRYLKYLKTDERIKLDDFMSCIIHQMLQLPRNDKTKQQTKSFMNNNKT